MEASLVVAIVGMVVGVLQGLIVFILIGVKSSQETMWKRVNSHYHEQSCSNGSCKNLKSGNVILPQGSS
jgi:hypothetical protein